MRSILDRYLCPLREGEGTGSGGTSQAETPAQTTPIVPPTPDPAPAPAPTAAAVEPALVPQSRVDELVAQRWAEKRAREAAEAELALANQALEQFQRLANGDTTPPAQSGESRSRAREQAPADLDELVRARAAEMRFAEDCNAVAAAGKAAHPEDFDVTLRQLQSFAGGALPRQFTEAALATGRAEEVIYALGRDAGRANEILSLPPLRQIVELARMAEGFAKPASRAVSSTPAPIRSQVTGNGGPAEQASTNTQLPIDEWMRVRDAEEKREREARV